jgi:hypothetical protein
MRRRYFSGLSFETAGSSAENRAVIQILVFGLGILASGIFVSEPRQRLLSDEFTPNGFFHVADPLNADLEMLLKKHSRVQFGWHRRQPPRFDLCAPVKDPE